MFLPKVRHVMHASSIVTLTAHKILNVDIQILSALKGKNSISTIKEWNQYLEKTLLSIIVIKTPSRIN